MLPVELRECRTFGESANVIEMLSKAEPWAGELHAEFDIARLRPDRREDFIRGPLSRGDWMSNPYRCGSRCCNRSCAREPVIGRCCRKRRRPERPHERSATCRDMVWHRLPDTASFVVRRNRGESPRPRHIAGCHVRIQLKPSALR